MKRLAPLIISAAAIAALAIPSAALANASNLGSGNTPGTPNGTQVGSSQGGKNMTTTQFTASYVFNVNWQCSGVHQVGKNTTQDSETCLLSGDEGLYPTGTTTTYGSGVWNSDYNGVGDATFTVTKTANSDGTFTLNILATY